MLMELDRDALIVKGSTFQVSFRRDRSRLRALVTGALASLQAHSECWGLIAAETVRSGASMLLVVDHSTDGEVTAEELEQFIHNLVGLGLENVRTAYVGADSALVVQREVAEIFAREKGFVARVFGIEAEALLWLRHGER